MEVSRGFFFLPFYSFSFFFPHSPNKPAVIKCHHERGIGLLKRKALIFKKIFIYEESHQGQAVINTHNWNKLQLTAEKCLPAADRRKLLTAFSHSTKKRERGRREPCPAHANPWPPCAHARSEALVQPEHMYIVVHESAHADMPHVQVQTQLCMPL